jgi:hypothetical protein
MAALLKNGSNTYIDLLLYRWKPGDTVWHQVASAPIHRLVPLLILEHPEAIWMVQYKGYYTVQQLSKPETTLPGLDYWSRAHHHRAYRDDGCAHGTTGRRSMSRVMQKP